MLLHLIAFGLIGTSGTVIEPGTGDVDFPTGQMASARPITAASGVGTGVPTTAFIWTQPIDPSDRRPYGMDWTPVLGADEKIASIQSLTMTALGVSLGVEIDDDADRVPFVDTDGKKIAIWLKVADAFKTNAAFNYPGTKVGIAAMIRTDADPYEEIERTWVLTVAQQ